MPNFFGLSGMPTTLLNAVLSTVPDRSVPVRGPDRLAVVSPMYNEEDGARRALTSLLMQRRLPDELIVSINGTTDRTHEVVSATLAEHGFERTTVGRAPNLTATLERWRHRDHAMDVAVVVYARQTAKSEAINNLVASHIVRSERVLLVDGDTVFEPEFIAALERNFYRLRWIAGRPVLEDYALQSGSVTSYVPEGAGPTRRFIAAGRSAEYAFAAVLRRGQVGMLGDGGLWGASRLYTVVGCGFVVRRDVLPMPPDTQTEDHDLTLAVQRVPRRVERLTPAELSRRGFRIIADGVEQPFENAFDRHDVIELRHGGNARFVGEALMYTEDPAHLGGYLRQIDRWNGGGIQNALKRVLGDPGDRVMSPNVRFTLWAAQLENLLGLLLLLLLPVILALTAAGTIGTTDLLRILAIWSGLDLAATGLMTFAGFYVQARDGQRRRGFAVRFAGRRMVRTWVPYMVLKVANPVSFVAAATSVIPAFLAERRAAARSVVKRTQGVAWERPTARGVDARTIGTAASMVVALSAVFVAILALAPASGADQVAVERLLARTVPLHMAQHEALPLPIAQAAPALLGGGPHAAALPLVKASIALPLRTSPLPALSLSAPRVRVTLAGGPAAPATPEAVTVLSRAGGATTWSGHVAPAAGNAAGSGLEPISTLSAYCRPVFLRHPSAVPQPVPGSAGAYRPLDPFELLMLGRLAPIEPYIEQAASAYDVPVRLMLQVLINESYLDPLAVGETGDKGLSQMTSDALTLLRAISEDPGSALYNPHLLNGSFNVFDPDFSVCAGAAKLAWSLARPVVTDDAVAYALYINPLHGVTRSGRVAPNLRGPVDAMVRLGPLADALGSAYAAYRADPSSLAAPERRLVALSAEVASGKLDLASAYRRSHAIVVANGVDDGAVYSAVQERLFARGSRATVAPTDTASAR